ncbi:hypothetical protein Q3G72_004113 [Acer saccharum]|nr:hypothetical protein Q3G72_004113 [Acer saccharum]
MRSVSVPPDFHSFPFVLKACSQLGSLFSAQAIHSQALKFGFVSDLFFLNSLIHVYSVSHRLRDAHYVFDESSHRDVVSYNALIDGYAKAGDVAKARELFDKMPFRDSVSWGTLVSGYAKSGQCKEGIKLFHEMMELNIRPDNIALVSALSACAQLGELECGKRIHDYIEHNRIQVDSFLSTGIHGNVEVAEQAAEHVMELKPEDGGVYKIMADLYANAERWEDVVKIRTCMDAGKIKKIAGCSLIQLNGVMHEFVAGDDLHPRTDEIYVVLNAITKHQYEPC